MQHKNSHHFNKAGNLPFLITFRKDLQFEYTHPEEAVYVPAWRCAICEQKNHLLLYKHNLNPLVTTGHSAGGPGALGSCRVALPSSHPTPGQQERNPLTQKVSSSPNTLHFLMICTCRNFSFGILQGYFKYQHANGENAGLPSFALIQLHNIFLF